MAADEVPVPDSVVETLRRDPDVEFAVAFGSRVEGHSRAGSDLDIGVKFSDALTSGERFRKRCRLSGRLQSDEAPFVDVSDLDSLPPDVARAAVKGEPLCGDDDDRREFDERIEALAEDAQSAERHRDVIRRVAEEGLRG